MAKTRRKLVTCDICKKQFNIRDTKSESQRACIFLGGQAEPFRGVGFKDDTFYRLCPKCSNMAVFTMKLIKYKDDFMDLI